MPSGAFFVVLDQLCSIRRPARLDGVLDGCDRFGMPHIDMQTLGESMGPVDLATAEDNRVAALTLASRAQRTLHIFTRDLDAPVYDTAPFSEAVAALAVRSRYSLVHILLQDADRIARHGHRLLALFYRLDSKIKLRKPADEYKDFNEAFLIADEAGVLHRRIADRYDGIVDLHAPRHARELVTFFNDAWGRSEAYPELRRLHL